MHVPYKTLFKKKKKKKKGGRGPPIEDRRAGSLQK
jgi:hypothetical protein